MLDTSPHSRFDIVPWNPSFETGIEIIDTQHRQLVRLLNQLGHGYVSGLARQEVAHILNALVDYAGYHFATEEALWAEVSVKDALFSGHVKAHSQFVNKIQAMQLKLKSDDSHALMEELLSFLITWLAHHILYEDKHFSLVFALVQEGVGLKEAKQQAKAAMTGQTSVLIKRVLSMYKKVSSRALILEREAYSRRVVEEALEAQEQHWSSVLGASGDSLWDWDFSSSKRVEDEQQLTANLFSKDGFTVHPDDWLGLKQKFLTHMMGQSEVFLHQHRVLDAAGNERWIQSRGKVIEQDLTGRPKRMVGTQTDITARKVAELRLQRQRDTRTLISEFATDFMVSSAEDFDAAVNRALQRSCEYMQADRAYVFLISADGYYINNTHEWCTKTTQPEIENLQAIPVKELSWWFKQLSEKGYLLLPRVSDLLPEAKNEYHLLALQKIHSLYAYPLYVASQLVGFMGCDSVGKECHWEAESIEFLSLVGDLLGIALGHRQLNQKRVQAINQLEQAEALAHLGHWRIDYALSKMEWSQEVFRIFECDAQDFAPSLAAYLQLVHPEDRTLVSLTYKKAKTRLSDLHLEHRVLLKDDKVKHLEVRGHFNTSAEGCLLVAEGTIQDVTEKVQHRESLQRLAFEDSLTGLPNRRSIERTLVEEVDYCQKNQLCLVLALLDLDNFSEINDQHGAALGDALLIALAQRIKQLLKGTAVVARVGGDEFAVLFTRLPLEESYYQKLNRLLAAINKPFYLEGIKLVLTASMGVTEYPQPLVVAGEQLVRQAQQALFQAKIMGKGHFQQYDISLEQDARALSDQLEQIQAALYAGEFVLYYQPKVCMKSGVVFGVEALVRWQKTNGELVMPGEFLPALYNHPLEVELGDWVIRTALAQMRVWKQLGLAIQVSVNVSSLQLFDAGFVEKLANDLALYSDVSPSNLQLEVLESSMLHDLEVVSEVMQRSRQLGVSFALDDFGTGYSSLAYLKYLPASVLKIDQSFVREMMRNADDLSIISGVIGMANAFGMQVIAEGIESIEQGDLLLRLGCIQGQGYGIARPMPAEAFPSWVEQWQAVPSWLGLEAVEIQKLPLLYAEIEHNHWLAELNKHLLGKEATSSNLGVSQCKLGLWIESESLSRFGLNAKYSNLVNLHRDLHKLGENSLALHAKGELNAALRLLPQIKHQQGLFLAELQWLLD